MSKTKQTKWTGLAKPAHRNRSLAALAALAAGDETAFDAAVDRYARGPARRVAFAECAARLRDAEDAIRRWQDEALELRGRLVGVEVADLTGGGAGDAWLDVMRAASRSTDGEVRAAVERLLAQVRSVKPELADAMAQAFAVELAKIGVAWDGQSLEWQRLAPAYAGIHALDRTIPAATVNDMRRLGQQLGRMADEIDECRRRAQTPLPEVGGATGGT